MSASCELWKTAHVLGAAILLGTGLGIVFFCWFGYRIGACWLPVVAIQLWLKRETERVSSAAALPQRFRRMFRSWFALGIPAFAAVVVLFYLMVAKPLSVTTS